MAKPTPSTASSTWAEEEALLIASEQEEQRRIDDIESEAEAAGFYENTTNHYENTMAKPTASTAQPTASSTAEWTPPQDAQARQQHRAALSALPRGSAVRIHRDGRPPALGWSWCGMYDRTVGLIRGPEGQQASINIFMVEPAPEAAA